MIANENIHAILLIDDDADEHEFFSSALGEYNSSIRCMSASSCGEAKSLIQSKKPCVIFLDMNMPGTDGLTCLNKMKMDMLLQCIPVFMYSTSIDPNNVAKAIETGAVKWFKKPVTSRDFEWMFDECIRLVSGEELKEPGFPGSFYNNTWKY